MQSLAWLGFSSVMIAMMAYGPYGNPTAATLATLAMILTLFVRIKVTPRSSSSPLLSSRGGKKKEAKPPAKLTTEKAMTADKIRQKLASLTAASVQAGMSATISAVKDGNAFPAAVNLGCNTALCALVPVVPLIIKKPDFSKEEAKKNPQRMLDLINFETILFAALITARMHRDMRPEGDLTQLEGGMGLEISADTEFGPSVLGEALNDWKKLTGKNPADYFEKGLVEAAEEAFMDSKSPFDEFLQKRITSVPSSKTFQ